jgi:hypothetical protein
MAIVEKNDTIQIEQLELGPFGTNAYILHNSPGYLFSVERLCQLEVLSLSHRF